MARAKMGMAFASISGAIGAIIIYVLRSGVTVIRQKPTAVRNPNSVRQAAVRNRLSVFNNAWNNILSSGEQAMWGGVAKSNYRENTGGSGVRALKVDVHKPADILGIYVYLPAIDRIDPIGRAAGGAE